MIGITSFVINYNTNEHNILKLREANWWSINIGKKKNLVPLLIIRSVHNLTETVQIVEFLMLIKNGIFCIFHFYKKYFVQFFVFSVVSKILLLVKVLKIPKYEISWNIFNSFEGAVKIYYFAEDSDGCFWSSFIKITFSTQHKI